MEFCILLISGHYNKPPLILGEIHTKLYEAEQSQSIATPPKGPCTIFAFNLRPVSTGRYTVFAFNLSPVSIGPYTVFAFNL